MGEAFIVRKGGGGAATKAPSINFVSKTETEIVFTITNNDTETADIFWEVDDTTPDANTLSLVGGATSSNLIVTGLDENQTYTIYTFANIDGKAGSDTVSLTQTTIESIYTAATGGTTLEYDDGGKRYKSHTFTSSGTLTITNAGNFQRSNLEYLVIGGGGGGGGVNTNTRGFGGGAGDYKSSVIGEGSREVALSVPLQAEIRNYSVIIGQAGSAQNNGGSSEFDSIVAEGGSGGTTSAKGNYSGSGGVSKIRTGSNETRGAAGSDGATGGNGGNGASATANTGNGGNGVNKRTAVSGSDCSQFICSGGWSSTHCNGCHSNPSNYASYFNHQYNAGSGGSGIVIVRYEIEPV